MTKTIRRTSQALAVALIASILSIGAAAAPARAAVFNPQTFTLDNGLRVVLVENHATPAVVQMVWYAVGSGDDPAGFSGIAHFLEHLMFKGTQANPPGAFSTMVARVGGSENAFTSWDYTAYYQIVAPEHLAMVMELEADRMTGLALTDELVDPERDVIREERRNRIENNPGAKLGVEVRSALYAHYPYRIPVIGWSHEIDGLTTEVALDFYHRWYRPDNAVLVVAGDVTMDQLRPLAERTYGAVDSRGATARARVVEPPHLAPRAVVMVDPTVGQPSWSRYYLAPSRQVGASEQVYALEVLADILGDGTDSRLYKDLVIGDGEAINAGAYYDGDAIGPGSFVIYGTPSDGDDLDAAINALEAAVDAEIQRVIDDGVSDEEVARAVRQMQTEAVFARDSLMTPARVIGEALMTGRTVADVEEWPERIGAVTAAEVQAAAAAVFDRNQSVTATLLPEIDDGEDVR